MHHEHIGQALQSRGTSPGLTAAHLRELSGLRAYISLPGAGSSHSFLYNRGGKQGGVETPDQWNALLDHMLEGLIRSWTARGFGFLLDYEDGNVECIHHAVWCDNIFLFARCHVMISTMISEITATIQNFDMRWKPTSLEIMPC
eukprot:11156658-Karenia_brevis.AAC.1